jgi:hypothetical protein
MRPSLTSIMQRRTRCTMKCQRGRPIFDAQASATAGSIVAPLSHQTLSLSSAMFCHYCQPRRNQLAILCAAWNPWKNTNTSPTSGPDTAIYTSN